MSEAPPESLREELLHRINAGTGAAMADEEFDRLARAVFAHQFACNPPYRAFCERRGVSPATVAHWGEIPAVPTDAFKAAARTDEFAATGKDAADMGIPFHVHFADVGDG